MPKEDQNQLSKIIEQQFYFSHFGEHKVYFEDIDEED